MAITRRAMIVGLGYLGLACFGGAHALADGPPAGRRIALRGYDPVTYFTDGKPAKGSIEFWYAFDDAVYLFRSAQHREQFARDPERFAPQYDGYCAGGISKNYKVEPDPEAWLIANGRLFVFQFQDRVPMFRKIIDEVATTANENWPRLRKQP